MLDGVVRWPDAIAEEYRRGGYWAGVSIGQAFDRSFAANSDRVAVVDGTRRTTYGALAASVDVMARHLVEREVCGGARVVFQLPNILEFIVLYAACLKVGAVPVMCFPHHREAEITALANLSQASALFVCSRWRGFDYATMAGEILKHVPTLREVWVVGEQSGSHMTSVAELQREPPDEARSSLASLAPAPSATAVLQLSGGTTGLPKLIPRTHDDYLYNSTQFAAKSSFDGDSVLLVALPIAHNFSLACPGIQGALLLGSCIVLAPSPSPDTVLPLIESERVTWVPAVPATLIHWTEAARRTRHDFSSLRAIYVGGQRLNSEPAAAAARVFGPTIRQVYGMAEGLLCCTRGSDPANWHLETQGRPISPADDVRIVGDDGVDVPTGEVGELICRGPYTVRGYYRAVEHNRTAFTEDGYYRTGDLVRQHATGNFVVEGRKKDVIVRGGEKIGAEEIENLILSHPAVANVAVVAMPDAVLGERVCACVVLRSAGALTLPDLRRFLAQEKQISMTKLPERLQIMASLPATAVGKVSKKDLREFVRRELDTEGGQREP